MDTWETPDRPQILPCCFLSPPAEEIPSIFSFANKAFVTAKLSQAFGYTDNFIFFSESFSLQNLFLSDKSRLVHSLVT